MKKLITIAICVCMLSMSAMGALAATTVSPYYNDGVVTVEVSGATGNQIAVLAIEGEMDAEGAATTELGALTTANLISKTSYIDQKAAAAGAASFVFEPKDADGNETIDETVTIYASDGQSVAVKPMALTEHYKVSFAGEGVSLADKYYAVDTPIADIAAAANVPTRMGYTFVEWTIEGEAIANETLSADITLTAVWTENFATVTDKGYCTDANENVTGVASASSAYNKDDKEAVSKYGFVIYKGGQSVVGNAGDLDALTTFDLSADADKSKESFFTLVYGIAQENFAAGVYFIPYAVDGENTVWGAPKFCNLGEGELKDLGSLEKLLEDLGVEEVPAE